MRSLILLLLLALGTWPVIAQPGFRETHRLVEAGWATKATSFRGRNGERITFAFPAHGAPGSLWGTGLYTDDSSIATAAVHEGLITLEGGGVVTIEIRPGAPSYLGSQRYGIRSGDYGGFSGSYVFVKGPEGFRPAPPPEVRHADRPMPGDWNTKANEFRGRIGERITYAFPGHGAFGSVWGTGLYTDDSSIATAAVHEGLISPETGGVVTIEIRPGAPSYRGSQHYGVHSGDYGGWQGSFVFVHAPEGIAPPAREVQHLDRAIPGNWSTKANEFRGRVGERITFSFPGHGEFGSVWGTGLYTDDSSIATAAVHEGLLNPEFGGVVTIEIRPGSPSYRGSHRNGVHSSDFGAWQGSFVFVDRR